MDNNNVKLIGLTGAARSGKDTAAKIIRDHMIDYCDAEPDFSKHIVLALEAFAAPLKSMLAMLLDFFGRGNIMQPETLAPYLDGDRKEEVLEEIGVSCRSMLQTLGTDWGREKVHRDLWLNCMKKRIEAYTDVCNLGYSHALVVITDVRFDNEAKLVKELGGVVVQVCRDTVPEVGDEDHPSEAGVSPHLIDMTVKNNGTVEEFGEALKEALGDLLPPIPEYKYEEEPEDEAVEM